MQVLGKGRGARGEGRGEEGGKRRGVGCSVFGVGGKREEWCWVLGVGCWVLGVRRWQRTHGRGQSAGLYLGG